MTRFFITRPIFASVLSIIIVLAGLAAAFKLPIAQYPQIAPPTVLITASYPGASAETLSRTVAAPIEEQLSGVENLLYFNSSSDSSGTLTITATFDIGTNVDQATFNVSNRVNIALPRLPEDVRRTGVVVQKRSNDILLVVMLISKKKEHDRLFLSNYATLNVLDEFKRIKGVGDVTIFGGQDYSMRVWLRPDRMAQLGVSTSDISAAISAQNAQYAAGKIGAEPALPNQQLAFTVTAKGRLIEPEEFGNIIIRAQGPNGVLRLKDVARIELGAQTYNVASALNGQPGVALPIFLQSGANALETAEAIKAKVNELKLKFPEGMDYNIPYDTSDFVKATIKEVFHTFGEALILVVLVVFLFLQSWRATLIPMIAVPISIVGTFAGLYLFGFSINLLTLFAMILAIGIVVDDAIVVLENTERLMKEENLNPLHAAIKSIAQVQAAVIAIVLVLCAVFVPVAFQGGIAGELYRQFAVTVAISVVISGVVALTLTPALCAMILKNGHHENAFFRTFNRGFNRLTNLYTGTVKMTLHHKIIGAVVFGAMVIVMIFLFRAVPGGFVPPEDQGYVISIVVMPDGATLKRTSQTTENIRAAIAKDPATAHEFAVNGFELLTGANKTNAATMFVRMKDWDARTTNADQMVGKLIGVGMSQPDGMGFAVNPPAIRGLGSAGGFEVYVQSHGDTDPIKLAQVMNNFMDAMRASPQLTGINSFFRPTVPQLFIEVDEAKALSQNVKIADIYATLQSTMGSLYVNDFNRSGRTYRVQLQAEAEYRMKPEDLGKVYVRSQPTEESPNGNMVPMSALAKVSNIVGAEQLERYNGLLSAKVFGSGAAGVSSGDAIKLVEKIAKENLPDGYQIAWTGQAYQENRTGSAALVAFAFATIMVFLILAAQFETWALPLAVIMAIPFAMTGALIAVLTRGMNNDIYFQIGLITLIGLAAKNAILIVEFASQKMEEGMPLAEAALEAARLRFRPIVMTSMAFMLGIIPLVFATGAGAAARQSMGTGVFGGMLIATFIATIFIPLFFTWLTNEKKVRHHGHISEEESV
ncbi:efflux RND transporter permease subunit [Methylophilus medardicus]|uniref:Efflux pump membrane transporter n=1 Tax=Methylophilus medardicus TaxID=2588534 RepID=A0A5B8CQ93_9PROT|nr:multidrug efflux RND transporter permease subunit [Methylophilus medardicus]QDC43411.1 multidrug efflux RND transporter permease subunit [Methylophilus medardicus]QDC48418.1 multidrug efflux RND transporter permease subunit [Methylophilus medardicus]QDC52123.1 multidrug efflux RND transporter permease subunit [Methylophilus medardicus]